jgi:hypothetical protein
MVLRNEGLVSGPALVAADGIFAFTAAADPKWPAIIACLSTIRAMNEQSL